MSANSWQIGGSHYKVGGEEHWDRVARLNLDYFQGQITKYVERWRLKNGIQDLEKAQHFLTKYIEIQRAKEAAMKADELAEHKILMDEVISQQGEATPAYVNQDGAPGYTASDMEHVKRSGTESFTETVTGREIHAELGRTPSYMAQHPELYRTGGED